MKLSQFTIIEEINENFSVVFNTFSKALVIIHNEVLNHINNNNIEIIEKEELQRLRDTWIIVDKELEEITIFNGWMAKYQYKNKRTQIFLFTTLSCNLGCTYCFQGADKPSSHLSNTTIDAFVNYLEQLCDINHTKNVDIVLFGGEPLLNKIGLFYTMETIQNVIGKKVKVNFSMITNGTLIHSFEEVERLYELGLRNIQITVDGPKELHDSRRMYINGKGTFSTIEKSLELVTKKLKVNVRVNFDNENIKEVYDLIDYFERKDYKDKLSFSFSWVFSDIRIDESYSSKMLGGNNPDVAKYIDNFIKYSRKSGFSTDLGYDGPCMITSHSSFALDPKGNLYSCPAVAGLEKFSWGNVNNNKIDEVKHQQYTGNTVWQDKHCIKCEYLPICTGGCQWQGYERTGTFSWYCEKPRIDKTIRLKLRRTYEEEISIK